MNRVILMVTALMFFVRETVWANGGKLLELCKSTTKELTKQSPEDLYNSSHCFGYIEGITDTNLMYEVYLETKQNENVKPLFCVPDNGSISQVTKVVIKYLEDHPEKLHEHEISIVTTALRQAFPCA